MKAKDEIHWDQLPFDFDKCSRSDCPRAEECLHYLLYHYSDPTDSGGYYFHPHKPTIGKACQQFISSELKPFYRGFVQGTKLVPYGEILQVREQIMRQCHIARSTYYKVRQGEKPLTTEQAQVIIKTLRKYGIKEDQIFDSIELRYDLE